MISVVVPIFLSKEDSYIMTEKCINTARRCSTQELEWIIVETESDLFKDHADVHIYEKNRTSCTASINRGLKIARGEYVIVLTNDVFVEQGWDEALLACFKKHSYCGMSTLATTQLKHKKSNVISEGVWCSVYMIRNWVLKELNYLDENFVNSWDDSDLVMRLYEKGYKMLRNYNCVVEHNPGSTHYIDAKHMDNFNKNKELFIKKHKNLKDNDMYKILTEGWVV